MKKFFTLILVAMAAIAANAAVTFTVTLDDAAAGDLGGDVPHIQFDDEAYPGQELTKVNDSTYTFQTDKTGDINFTINDGFETEDEAYVYSTTATGVQDYANINITINKVKVGRNGFEWQGTTTVVNPSLFIVGSNGVTKPMVANTATKNAYVCSDSFNNGQNFVVKDANGNVYGPGAADDEITFSGDNNSYEHTLATGDGKFCVGENTRNYGVYYIEVFTNAETGVPESILITTKKDVITAVNDVNAVKNVAGVRYYNLQGMQSAEPFSGINIMVTNYTDGTTSTAKVIR